MAAELRPIATEIEEAEVLCIARRTVEAEEYRVGCVRGIDRALAQATELNRAGWTVELQGCGFDYRRTLHPR